MTISLKGFLSFALLLLLATLVFGVLSSSAFLYPVYFNKFLPFYLLRPLHVSAAVFWIITGATGCIIYYRKEVFEVKKDNVFIPLFKITWVVTILAVFIAYAGRLFGGKEYWEFPPILCIPLLVAWLFFMLSYFPAWKKHDNKMSAYSIMWSTGILFFLITFIEQNLWQIHWFRQSYLREITVQWKANGSMVGAWNQMIYGTFFFLMTRLSGDEMLARGKKVYFFYFLGLTNLMFNWGHHIYNVPTAGWIRHVAYAISMTEWLFLINIIQGFKSKLSERRKLNHFITYRFLITAEIWVFINLLLAIAMSIPAINRYTHGTHITVAHAMGATIGINTMILLGGIGYMIGIERLTARAKRILTITHYVAQVSLGIFWVSLVIAGLLKAYRSVAMNITDFQLMMKPVFQVLSVFAIAGIGLLAGLGIIVIIYLLVIWKGIQITTAESNKR